MYFFSVGPIQALNFRDPSVSTIQKIRLLKNTWVALWLRICHLVLA